MTTLKAIVCAGTLLLAAYATGSFFIAPEQDSGGTLEVTHAPVIDLDKFARAFRP